LDVTVSSPADLTIGTAGELTVTSNTVSFGLGTATNPTLTFDTDESTDATILFDAVTDNRFEINKGIDSSGEIGATTFDADTGYQIGNAAATGEYLRGNGTNFVSATIAVGDLPAGHVDALTDLSATLCGTTEILEDQGASWACIATPTGGGAPTTAQYIVGSLDATLTADKLLTDGTGVDTVIAGGDGGSATISFDFSDAGADIGLGVDEARFTSNATVAGYLVFEGDTADTVETRIAVTDPTTTDKVFVIPDANTIAPQASTCTNEFFTALNGTTGALTCTTATLASAQFANQGTVTTVLHGNASGNPSFGAVVAADLAAGFIDATTDFAATLCSVYKARC